MNYTEALDFIHGTMKYGLILGLSSIRELLEILGRPDREIKFIHVAGTNGKGSTTTTIASILTQAGYRVGIYTSPFIENFNESISIDGVPIFDADITELTAVMKAECDEMDRAGKQHPTEFELVTALAFLYFRRENCNFVVLEVGLGGRLDATNVIENPLVTVITSISFDHMEYLGDTIAKITAEKCGIIKSCPVVVYPEQPDEAWTVIKAQAASKRAPLKIPLQPTILKTNLKGTVFNYGAYENLSIVLLGEHQVKNAVTAISAIETLREQGVNITDDALRRGLKNVRWGGRFEIISAKPLFIIDGAHNMSGMIVFKKAIETYLCDQKLIFIMGILADKEFEECTALIAPMAYRFIAMNVPNVRSLPAQALADVAKKYTNDVYVTQSADEAVSTAIRLYDKGSAICAFGSLYLLGDIKRAIKKLK